MIYTTYFANLRNLPKNIVPISICGKTPDWYKGLQYKKIAPKYDFFMEWKKNHDNNYYIEHYEQEVLKNLKVEEVIKELLELCLPSEVVPIYAWPALDIALVCYEKPSNFCHRHLVAKWLSENGYSCKEWVKNG